MREHAELLSSVRDDISEYKVSIAQFLDIVFDFRIYSCFSRVEVVLSTFIQASGSMSPRMQLLRERAAIHGSIAHVRLCCFLFLDFMLDALGNYFSKFICCIVWHSG